MMASALAFTVDGLSYEHLGGLNDGVRLLGFVGDKCPSEITIPATVTNDNKTYSVEVISSGAFLGSTELTSVKMESQNKNGVKYIEPNSFAGCTNLSKVTFSGLLESILAPGFSGQMGAFEGCTALETIILPASMDYKGEVDATAPHNICKWAFKNCTGLKTVIINAKKPYIEDEAFINCSSLQYFVSYNTEPWNLDSNTFQGIPSSATLIVPDGTKSKYQALSGWNAFNNIKEHSDVDLNAIIGGDDQPQSGGTAKLTIEDFTIKAGETQTMLIDLQNPDDQVTLVQFDLRLPDGLSIATGDDAIDIAGRTTWKKHTLTSNAIDGITRILLYSSTNVVIDGTSGAIISIKLTASNSFNGGDIKLENQLMTTPDLVESKPATYTYNIKGGGDNPPVGEGEPYVVYNDGTLTFYYDNQRSSRQGTTYDLNTGDKEPGWIEHSADITKAVFDASFVDAKPKTTSQWFYECSTMTEIEGIVYLNTSNVTSMFRMFDDCSGLTSLDVSNFNTSNVTIMQYMFWRCSGLTSLDVSNFNTSNVVSMSHMFGGCSGLTSLDVSNFNTMPNMTSLFDDCSGLTSLDVSNFNTENVTYMSGMFSGCSGLTTLDVSHFNTSNVTLMRSMFSGCSNLTSLDVSHFETGNVTDMSSMFYGCSKLSKLTLGNCFTTTEELKFDYLFANCNCLNTVIFTDDIPASINSKFFEGVGTASDPATLEVPDAYKANYQAKFDGNMFFGGYFKLSGNNPSVSGEPYVVFNGSTMTFYCDDQRSSKQGAIYDLNTEDKDPAWMDVVTENVTTAVFDVSFANARPTTTFGWFHRCHKLTEIKGMENLNTSNVTNMTNMFRECSKLTSLDLSHFNTANVTCMYAMFQHCRSLTTLDLSSFNTAKVIDMTCMFYDCSKLAKLILGNFNTGSILYKDNMFDDCRSLNTVTFTGDIPISLHELLFEGVGTASAPATLEVPEQFKDNYQAKFNGNMFYGGYFTLKGVTSVNSILSENQPQDVYSLNGTLLRKNATSLKSLPKGVYIVNGRKVVIK